MASGAITMAQAALPSPVSQALQQAGVPVQSMAVIVEDSHSQQVLLSHQPHLPMNPASVIKLITTQAGLLHLGPEYRWRTPVWIEGAAPSGAAPGHWVGRVTIKGSGDPKLNLEAITALLQRVQQAGVRHLQGDLVLDQSAFAPPAGDPGDFDGEPARPYNVQARALLLNQRTVIYKFTPDPSRKVAHVVAEPALDRVQVQATVPLGPGPCLDWRAELKASWSTDQVGWAGRYPGACGERQWPVAYAAPQEFDARLLKALWIQLGGSLQGQIREGLAPSSPPSWHWESPPLREVVKDINTFSNNPMAEMLALSLAQSAAPQRPTRAADARQWLHTWSTARLHSMQPSPESTLGLAIDNGSGLSRDQRITAHQLMLWLRDSANSRVADDFWASLPVSGAEGTLRRMTQWAGRAQLKTGSLRDVAAAAGQLTTPSGRTLRVVAIIHHPQAQQARGALQALWQWAMDTDAR